MALTCAAPWAEGVVAEDVARTSAAGKRWADACCACCACACVQFLDSSLFFCWVSRSCTVGKCWADLPVVCCRWIYCFASSRTRGEHAVVLVDASSYIMIDVWAHVIGPCCVAFVAFLFYRFGCPPLDSHRLE